MAKKFLDDHKISYQDLDVAQNKEARAEMVKRSGQLGVPVIVGVPFRNIEQWRIFAEGLAEECAIESSRPHEWLLLHGFNIREQNANTAASAITARFD